jgi:hypothetical protein
MSVVLTSAEINLLWTTRTAQQDYIYVCEDGFLYKGQKDGTLQRIPNTNLDDWTKQRDANQSLPFRNKTTIQGTSSLDGSVVDVKMNPDGSSFVEVTASVLPTGASTETTQLEVLDELKLGLSSSNTQIDILTSISENSSTSLNQYTQLELLNLMYEELMQINKTLKKIYQ